MNGQAAKRRKFPLSFGNLYVLTGKTFMDVTVPFENTHEKRSLRQIADKIADNAPHRDWQGSEQFIKDCWNIAGDYPHWVEDELNEVIQCLTTAAEEYNAGYTTF